MSIDFTLRGSVEVPPSTDVTGLRGFTCPYWQVRESVAGNGNIQLAFDVDGYASSARVAELERMVQAVGEADVGHDGLTMYLKDEARYVTV